MNDREKIISAIEKAKKQSEEYAQDSIILPFREADMILSLLKDQPEIIRCKDCKHYDGDGTCMKIGIAFLSDHWFCADGKKR